MMTEILVKVCGRYQNLSVRLVMEAGFTGSKSSALWISGFRGIGSVQAACTKTRSGTFGRTFATGASDWLPPPPRQN